MVITDSRNLTSQCHSDARLMLHLAVVLSVQKTGTCEGRGARSCGKHWLSAADSRLRVYVPLNIPDFLVHDPIPLQSERTLRPRHSHAASTHLA